MAKVSLKNTTNRNVSVLGSYCAGGVPQRLMIPALTTVEFDKAEITAVKKPLEKLLKALVLEIVVEKVVVLDLDEDEPVEKKGKATKEK